MPAEDGRARVTPVDLRMTTHCSGLYTGPNSSAWSAVSAHNTASPLAHGAAVAGLPDDR
jgi:hypothetical protein